MLDFIFYFPVYVNLSFLVMVLLKEKRCLWGFPLNHAIMDSRVFYENWNFDPKTRFKIIIFQKVKLSWILVLRMKVIARIIEIASSDTRNQFSESTVPLQIHIFLRLQT